MAIVVDRSGNKPGNPVTSGWDGTDDHIPSQQAIEDDMVEDFTTVEAQVAANTANIATNTANIATNTANIATNTTAIAGKALKDLSDNTAANFAVTAAGSLGFATRSLITSPSNGTLLLTNNAGSSFTRLSLGGTTASFPAIVRNNADLLFKKADDSAYADIYANAIGFGVNGLLTFSASGVAMISDVNGTAFDRLQFGGTGVLYPALKRNGAGLEAKLADDSGLTTFNASQLQQNGVAVREKLAAARTYYVRTDGSDSNNGLANTAGGAFLTVQKAIDVVATLDFGGQVVTVQIADGTYAGAVTIAGLMVGQKSSADLILQGNLATPANVVFSYNTASSATILVSNGAKATIQGIKFNAAASNPYSIQASNFAHVSFTTCEFGVANIHLYCRGGSQFDATGNYTVNGAAAYHMRVEFGGRIRTAFRTLTTAGTPAFSSAFVYAQLGGIIECDNMTFSGTGATGVRYNIVSNGVVYTAGAATTYLPGGTAGTTATGGQYV